MVVSSTFYTDYTDMHRSFEDSLDKLRSRIIRMGSLVEEQVEFAFRALLENKKELATIVMERDDKVDKLDLKIDKHCQRLFALHQPVASDLRLLLVALKLNNELERIGDLAFNISRQVLSMSNSAEYTERLGLSKLTQSVFAMVKNALDSFVNNDPQLAYTILRTDDLIDRMTKTFSVEVVNIMKAENHRIDDSVAMLTIIKTLERMADQATNIAENVIFLIEAKLVRYLPTGTFEEIQRFDTLEQERDEQDHDDD